MTLAQLRASQDARRTRVTLQDLQETTIAFLTSDPPVDELVEYRVFLRQFFAPDAGAQAPTAETKPAAPTAETSPGKTAV